MVYPADGIHADQLEEGNIILAKPSDTGRSQPFRIYKIATPIDGKLTVKARHISYQLNFITVSPFATTGCTGALAALESHAASECPFEVWTDISSSASFRLSVPSSFRNCLGGIDGSVLDTFGGEYEWDRYTVKLHHHRGADHGVHIRHVMYNCVASRPAVEGDTNEDSKEVKTDKLTLQATPLANGYVKAKTGTNTSDDVYNKWYEKVYEPQSEASSVVTEEPDPQG